MSESSRFSGLRDAMAAAAGRVDEILTEAETAAVEIRREAELEAERYLAECRKRAHAEAQEQRAQFRRAMDRVRTQLTQIETDVLLSIERADAPVSPAADAPPPAGGQNGLAPEGMTQSASAAGSFSSEAELPGSIAPVARAERADTTAALIRACQLAVSGKDREEIQTKLRTEIGAERAAEIVNEIMPR